MRLFIAEFTLLYIRGFKMNIMSRSFLISCLLIITANAAPIKILEKQVDLGKDPKTQKTQMLKFFRFTEGTTTETADTRWFAVLPDENELVFLSLQNDSVDFFPVTRIISTQPSFVVEIDPTTQDLFVDPQEAKAAGRKPSMGTMQVTISPELQLFKEIIILIAKNNVKALENLANKRTLSIIEDAIQKALDCKGECLLQCDDPETLESIMQTKSPISKPIVLKGQVNFVPKQAMLKMQEMILEEAMAELEKEGQTNTLQKA